MSDPKKSVVLIVDDEPSLCEILAFNLENAGYETVIANGGYQALEIVKSRAIDVIVSDIRMPNGSGIELLDSIKKIMPDKPVLLFITAYADLSVDTMYKKGAAAVLGKPVKPVELLAEIERALRAS